MSSIRSPRTPENLTRILTRGLDAVSLWTLFSTGEIHQQWALLILSLSLATYLTRKREFFSRSFIIFLMVAVVLGSIALWPRFKLHPLIVAAHAGPLMHSLLWFLRQGPAQYHSRIALGFLQITLASALSPEFSVAVGIFVYFILASLQLMSLHLWSDFERLSPQELRRPIPRRSLFFGAVVSLIVLASSLLIFPFLPKVQSPWSNSNRWRDGSGSERGYTEQVGLEGSLQWFRGDSPNEGEPVFRAFLPNLEWEQVSLWFPLGLLKMRVLEKWTGTRWIPDPNSDQALPESLIPAQDRTVELRVIREPLPTDSLPTPYSVIAASVDTDLSSTAVTPQRQGLLRRLGMADKRVSYSLKLDPTQIALQRLPAPGSEATWFPTAESTLIQDPARWQRLSKRIFGGTPSSTRERLRQLRGFFTDAGFRGILTDFTPKSSERALDHFLFQSRQGHCEWFATTSLLLLRMASVPSRLVSGFRISSPPFGGILTVKQRDAHLWIEVWDSRSQHWIPFDPTPQTSLRTSLWMKAIDWLRDARNWATSHWYEWLLKPSDGTQSDFLKQWNPFANSKITWKSLKNPSSGWQALSSEIRDQARRVRELMRRYQALFLVTFLTLGALLIRLALKLTRGIRTAHWSHRSPQVLLRRLRYAGRQRALNPTKAAELQQLHLKIRFSGMTSKSEEFHKTLREIDHILRLN